MGWARVVGTRASVVIRLDLSPQNVLSELVSLFEGKCQVNASAACAVDHYHDVERFNMKISWWLSGDDNVSAYIRNASHFITYIINAALNQAGPPRACMTRHGMVRQADLIK